MKFKIFVASILTLFLSGQVGLNGSSQELKVPHENTFETFNRDSLITLKAIIKIQNKTIENNEDTVSRLRKSFLKRKHKEREVLPIIYQRVYVTVPIFVPLKDSLAFQKSNYRDTLIGDYYIDTAKKEHKSFFYRLFHHNQN